MSVGHTDRVLLKWASLLAAQFLEAQARVRFFPPSSVSLGHLIPCDVVVSICGSRFVSHEINSVSHNWHLKKLSRKTAEDNICQMGKYCEDYLDYIFMYICVN